MGSLLRYFRPVVEITGLTCVCIICVGLVYGVGTLVTSRYNLGQALYLIGLQDAGTHVAKDVDPAQEAQDEVRRQAVETDHKSVTRWVFDCTGAKGIEDFPEELRSDFTIPSDHRYFGYTAGPQAIRPLFRPERAMLVLSQSLSAQRMSLRSAADSAYRFWEVTSVITIALGMFTTILVSLSSTEFGRGDGRIQRLIRILAIVFPALATASAAVIAFYGPQAEWSQASRTLASLTQLHGQMAIGVWKLPCVKENDDAAAMKIIGELDGWSKRYVDIQTVSNVTSSGSSGSGGGGTSSSGGQQGAAAGGQQGSGSPQH